MAPLSLERLRRQPEGGGQRQPARVDDGLLLGLTGQEGVARRAGGRAHARRRLVGDVAGVVDAGVEEGAGGVPLGLLHGREVVRVAVDAVVVEVGHEVRVGHVGHVVAGHHGPQVRQLGRHLLGVGLGVHGGVRPAQRVDEGLGVLGQHGRLGLVELLFEGVLAQRLVREVVGGVLGPVQEGAQGVDDPLGVAGRRTRGAASAVASGSRRGRGGRAHHQGRDRGRARDPYPPHPCAPPHGVNPRLPGDPRSRRADTVSGGRVVG